MKAILPPGLMTLLKLLLGFALLALALSQVQWHDTLELLDADAKTVARYSGRVVTLDAEQLVFQLQGEVQPRAFALAQQQPVVRWGLRALLSRVSVQALLLVSGLYLLAVLLSAWRWWWLLHLTHLPLRFGQVLALTWIGLFFNNFLPGQTGGDVAKGFYLLKATPKARVPALGSLVLDRILGLLGLLFLALVALLNLQASLGTTLQLWVWGLFLGGSLGLVLLLSRRLRYWAQRYLHRILPQRLGVRLGQMETALLLYRKYWLALLGCFSLGLLNQISVVFGVALLGWAIGLDVPGLVFFILLPLLFLISALPLAPNGWGVGELSFGYLFAAYGAAFSSAHSGDTALFYTQGVALSVLFRLLLVLWSLPGGLFWLAWRSPEDISHAWQAGHALSLIRTESTSRE